MLRRPTTRRAVTAMPEIREKALHYLRDGKVRVVHSICRMSGPLVPYEVDAYVEGHNSTYKVSLDDGVWACTCHGPGEGCAHIAAVQLVTAPETSAAAKPQKERAA